MPESRITVARAALLEITSAESIGAFIEEVDAADGVTNLTFESVMLGYPGWKWTVSVAQIDGEDPTALETELMPADGALLAPDWVPWADRMDDYLAAQAAVAAALAEAGVDDDDDDGSLDDDDESDDDDDDDSDEDDDDSDDDDDDDDADDDADVTPVLHSGDIDGVDIDDIQDDELDGTSDDSDDEDDDVDDENDDENDDDRSY